MRLNLKVDNINNFLFPSFLLSMTAFDSEHLIPNSLFFNLRQKEAAEYGIEEFPKLVVFENGIPNLYDGGFADGQVVDDVVVVVIVVVVLVVVIVGVVVVVVVVAVVVVVVVAVVVVVCCCCCGC